MIMVRICDVFFFFFPISESLYQVEFFRWDKFSKYRSIRILRIAFSSIFSNNEERDNNDNGANL